MLTMKSSLTANRRSKTVGKTIKQVSHGAEQATKSVEELGMNRMEREERGLKRKREEREGKREREREGKRKREESFPKKNNKQGKGAHSRSRVHTPSFKERKISRLVHLYVLLLKCQATSTWLSGPTTK